MMHLQKPTLKTLKKYTLAVILAAFVATLTAPLSAQDTKAQGNASPTIEERMDRLEKAIAALTAAQAANAASTAKNNAPVAAATPAAPPSAPAASQYKKGLWMNIYQPNKSVSSVGIPDWKPLGAMVVTKFPLSPSAVSQDSEYKRYYSTPLQFMWEGFIHIKKPGNHTLIMELSVTESHTQCIAFTGVYLGDTLLVSLRDQYLNSNNVLALSSDEKNLDPGFYKIRIPLLYSRWNGTYSGLAISLKLMEPDARRARTLTTDDLFYKE